MVLYLFSGGYDMLCICEKQAVPEFWNVITRRPDVTRWSVFASSKASENNSDVF